MTNPQSREHCFICSPGYDLCGSLTGSYDYVSRCNVELAKASSNWRLPLGLNSSVLTRLAQEASPFWLPRATLVGTFWLVMVDLMSVVPRQVSAAAVANAA